MLSRNKVAVPEGAAGTPPFWRDLFSSDLSELVLTISFLQFIHEMTPKTSSVNLLTIEHKQENAEMHL